MGGAAPPNPTLQKVHDAADKIITAAELLAAAGVLSAQPEVEPVAAGIFLVGAGLHGLAYAHEAWFDLVTKRP